MPKTRGAKVKLPGTLTIRRRYRGVGLIKVRSGTNDHGTFNGYLTMLDEFERLGATDALAMIQSRTLSLADAYSAFRKDGVKAALVFNPASISSLQTQIDEFLEQHDVSEKARREYGYVFKAMTKADKWAKSTLADLPAILSDFRKHCQKNGHARHFNYARSACMALARWKFGQHSPEWVAIKRIATLKVTKKQKRNPVPPAVIFDVMERLKEIEPKAHNGFSGLVFRRVLWSMVSTGMGWTEYQGDWEVADKRVQIHGTKHEHRERTVFVVGNPPVRYKMFDTTFRIALKNIDSEVGIYDLRRTYHHWLEMARIPRARRKVYCGHAASDSHDLYERHEREEYFQQDRKKLLRYLKRERAAWKAKRKEKAEAAA